MEQKAPQAHDAIQTAGKPSRLFYLDHLRAALVILVVLHHIALVYGAAEPSFYYIEPPFTDPTAFKVLLAFVLGNQAWFMGAFFLLAGYFTPGSFDRKGPAAFIMDRLLRLGIPMLLFIFVLGPISSIGFFLMPASLTGITTPLTWEAYPHLLNLGPLWFVAMLLVFSFGYALWRWLVADRPAPPAADNSRANWLGIALFTLALALSSYLFRMLVPLGQSVSLFVDYLSFPTIAYLPQYLSLFVLGAIAFRRGWFSKVSHSMGTLGFLMALAAGILLFPLAISGRLFSLEITEAFTNAFGGGHWQSAVYALWDSVFAVGICLALLPFFRRYINRQTPLGSFLSRQGYAVYILHIPIVVLLAYAMRNVALAPLHKFGLASLIGVPLCFLIAFAFRKIPGVSRII